MSLQKLGNIKYIVPYVFNDLQATGVYLPFSIAFAISVALVMVIVNAVRRLMGKPRVRVLPFVLFFVCLEVILDITLLSRSTGRYSVDLSLFATWRHVNSRNKAYVIENILLFVPYGFATGWLVDYLKPKVTTLVTWLIVSAVGILTSGLIEMTQYLTARGHLQVDDLVMNTLGAMLGGLCFAIVSTIASIAKFKRYQSTTNEDK